MKQTRIYVVDANGMRWGQEDEETPPLLGPFKVDSAIRKIHRHNNWMAISGNY